MRKILNLQPGIIPILPTPFFKDQSIDFSAYHKLVEFAEGAGVSAVGVPAYGSECYKLTETERNKIIDTVIKIVNGRMPVAVQCNHNSSIVAASLAMEAAESGADLINTAIPRAFPTSSEQCLDYCQRVCNSVSLPVIIQDWNPGGVTIGLDFVKKLHERCENFKYIKFEESGVGELMTAIEHECAGQVKVFSGWGGSYMLELMDAGLHGILPGLSMADTFARIWELSRQGDTGAAMQTFSTISPLIQFGLHNIEVFHHVEKRILFQRGLLPSATVRSTTVRFDTFQDAYLQCLIDNYCRKADA